jgi:uncharacterized protein
MGRDISNVVGFDDAPFARDFHGDVMVIGAVFSRTRLDGVLRAKVRRDGANATRRIIEMIERHQFRDHIRGVLLQGIALAGFNVVDIHGLHQALQKPVLVVTRRQADLGGVKRALLERVRGGARKWALIERAGPMERLGRLYVQRAGLTRNEALGMLRVTTLHGYMPEPLRVAHLIAGGIATGVSHGHA